MPDNPDLRGPRDHRHIDTTQSHELRYWSCKFGVTQKRLRDVVNEVGHNVDDVRRRLLRKPPRPAIASGKA